MAHINELYDFTASGYIIHPTELKLCLHYHRKYDKWMQPGGHIELDEDPIQALTHELEEEAGLKPDDYKILQQYRPPETTGSTSILNPAFTNIHVTDKPSHRHIDLAYVIRSKTTELTPQERESQKIGWFSLSEIQDMSSQETIHIDTEQIANWIFDNLPSFSPVS